MKHHSFIATTVLVAFILLSRPLAAQTIVGASNIESAITTGNVTDARNVNCDMIYHTTGGGQLRAVAYDDYNTTTSSVYLEDYSGGTTTVFIPGATDIDVVLGDDMNNPGTDYILAVVFNSSAIPIIETYTIVGVGSGSLTATVTNTAVLPLVTGGPSYLSPHIDLYPDPSNPISGIPSLHEFAVTWTEYNSGFDAYLTHGDIATPGSFINTYTITTGGTGYWPDVACLWDNSTNEPYAYVAYINGPDIDLWEVNLATTATTLTPTINAGPVQKSVRIEAMNLYDPSTGFQKYEIAYAADAGSGVLEIFSYNDIAGNINLSMPVLSVGNNIHPAVSAGPGQLVNGGYGNENHSVCWYNDGTPYYYSQAIEANTGMVNPAYPDYYEVNLMPTPFIVLDAYYAPIGVSTSSNWGDNELLTAWNNNNDIYYKYQGDIAQYKTTKVNTLSAAEYKLYPNPTIGAITIEGTTNARYTITDMAGCVLLQGSIVKGSNTIPTETLAKGLYVAAVSEDGKTTLFKFVKQ